MCLSLRPYFFCLGAMLRCVVGSLRYSPEWGNPLGCVVALYVGRDPRGNNAPCSLAWLFPNFQLLPLLSKSKLGSSGAISWVGGFVYILGPCGSLQQTLLWGREFLPLPQPPQIFTARGFEVLFPSAGNLGCAVCLIPQSFLPAYLLVNVEPSGLLATALPARFASLLHVLSAPAAHVYASSQCGWMFLL